MIFRLIIRPEAEEDMAEARNWYQGRQEGLGFRFLAAVEQVFDRILEYPETYAAEYKSIRRAGVARFPYVVYYRLAGDHVEVIAVLHGSRNPRGWRKRASLPPSREETE